MPLLCISLLALLLLPLSLSCSITFSDKELNMKFVLLRDLNNTAESIATLLRNSTCSALSRKPPNCMNDNGDALCTLHNLTCKMKRLEVSHTDQLVRSVLNTLKSPCPETTTRKPKRRRTVTRRKRNEQKIIKEGPRNLCKAKAFLSAMTVCCEKLNTQFEAHSSSS